MVFTRFKREDKSMLSPLMMDVICRAAGSGLVGIDLYPYIFPQHQNTSMIVHFA